MMRHILTDIKELVMVSGSETFVRGRAMDRVERLENAWLAVQDGRIAAYGSMDDKDALAGWSGAEELRCSGRLVLPCWCDSHTHLIFAGNRESEFEDRIRGLDYEAIAAKGGGIINSVAKLRSLSEDVLYESARKRLDMIMKMGTGTVEIKSGYGLDVASEMKMLRVARRLSEDHPLCIRTTLLGAHAIPPEFRKDKAAYIRLICDEMIPAAAGEGLADFIDVFCERNYFTADECGRILDAGIRHGLKPKVHVNQFSSLGGVGVCVDKNALSIDHLEVMEAVDYAAFNGSNTIATALPGCSFFLGINYTPARRLMDMDVPVAVATDFNPGSAPSGNMSFAVALSCIKMGMTPAEAITAATINGAAAMEVAGEYGSIHAGKRASLILTRPLDSMASIPYHFADPLVEKVMIDGEWR